MAASAHGYPVSFATRRGRVHSYERILAVLRGRVTSAASRFILAAVAALLVSSCGRSSGGNVLPIPLGYSNQSVPSQAAGLAATIRIFVPSSKAEGEVAPELLRQQFVAASTRGARIDVYARGRRSKPITSLAANLSANAPECKTIKRMGRSCSIVIDIAHTGDYDFVVDTYDRKPKNGRFAPSAKQLAAGVAMIDLKANRAIKVVLEGVVASTRVAAAKTDFPAIDPLSLPLTVEALDADGNAIVTDGYVDKKGQPVKIVMKAASAAGKTITFSPSHFTKPSAVALVYAPGSMSSSQAASGFSAFVTAAPNDGATETRATFTFKAPQLQLYTVPTSGSAPQNIAAGSDGALWFTEYQADQIGRITTTAQFQEFSATTAGDNPLGIAKGPNGNVWFTGQHGNTIDRITTSGTVTSYSIPTLNSAPDSITTGPDGNLWFTEYEGPKIGRVSSSGTGFAEFTLASGSDPNGITVGPDGALWFADCGGNAIGRITTTGSISTFSLPSGTRPYAIVTGSDRALWFADCSDFVGRMTTTGTLTKYTIPGNGEASDVALGPDGAIWFTVQTIPTETQSVGRISTSGVMTLYSVPGSNPFPEGITKGPDGAIWFTELNAGQIGRLQ